jgi:uncharacterized protein (DUF433 family)
VNPLLSRISIDANLCFRGTRFWVSLILDLLASGESEGAILAEYPQLTRDDILATLAYGGE